MSDSKDKEARNLALMISSICRTSRTAKQKVKEVIKINLLEAGFSEELSEKESTKCFEDFWAVDQT